MDVLDGLAEGMNLLEENLVDLLGNNVMTIHRRRGKWVVSIVGPLKEGGDLRSDEFVGDTVLECFLSAAPVLVKWGREHQ
jgi:hypothetical protein